MNNHDLVFTLKRLLAATMATTGLCIKHGLFTDEEWGHAVNAEAQKCDKTTDRLKKERRDD